MNTNKLKNIIKEILVEELKKVIYYDIFNDRTQKDFLILLTGATYDFKDVLFKHGWRWDSLNRGWKYNKRLDNNELQTTLEKLLNELSAEGVILSPGNHTARKTSSFLDKTKFIVPKYSNLIYPTIPTGKDGSNNVYIKGFHYYAPMTKVNGNGTKFIKELLKFFGFGFDSTTFTWQITALDSEDRKTLIKILKDNNYNVIEQDA